MAHGSDESLYERLGRYDAIALIAGDIVTRLVSDPQFDKYYVGRSDYSKRRELQLFIDYLCNAAGGPVSYLGHDMKLSHAGMGISGSDWAAFVRHLASALETFNVAEKERRELLALVAGTKADIVESS